MLVFSRALNSSVMFRIGVALAMRSGIGEEQCGRLLMWRIACFVVVDAALRVTSAWVFDIRGNELAWVGLRVFAGL